MMVVATGFVDDVVGDSELGAFGVGRRGDYPSSRSDCLIVCGDPAERKRLAIAAALAGWENSTRPANRFELREAADGDFLLAFIDICSPLGERVSDTIEIAEELAARPETLTVISGSEGSIDDELWARQLGIWLYLPGCSHGDSLTSLFVEARRLCLPAAMSLGND